MVRLSSVAFCLVLLFSLNTVAAGQPQGPPDDLFDGLGNAAGKVTSETAADVLDQLINGTIPPSPTPPASGGSGAQGGQPQGPPDDLFDGLGNAWDKISDAGASDTALGVLDQLINGSTPPEPALPGGPNNLTSGDSNALTSGGANTSLIPEPMTLSVLAIGGVALLRRKRK